MKVREYKYVFNDLFAYLEKHQTTRLLSIQLNYFK
jgi:hypothetical protein